MQPSVERVLLLGIVTFTGACVLIVEVISTRMLAPYFGNTIYSLSSILSVTLLALSCGYYVGGKMADKHPRFDLFFGIITAGGITVGLMRLIAKPILAALSIATSQISGPLIASLFLFLVPAFFLGMLSPFAIQLLHARDPKRGVGSVAGAVFFWSTIGSIVGSLLAGFLLIPTLGIQTILLSIAAALLLLGLGGLISVRGLAAKNLPGLALLLAFAALAVYPGSKSVDPNVLFSLEGLYQNIRVVRGEYLGEPVHMLFQDRNFSSAIFLAHDDLVFGYAPYYRLATDFRTKPLTQALFIGAGAFSLPREILLKHANVEVDVVDIEPGLFDIARRYFRLEPSPRLHWHVQDGRSYVRESDKKYDLIFSDVYQDFLATPAHITTKEFLELARSTLAEDGIFMANVIGSLKPSPQSFLFSEMRTFQEVFPKHRFFGVLSPTDPRIQNLIFMGCTDGARCIDPCTADLRNNSDIFLASLCGKQVNAENLALETHPILTDDFAPVEYLAAEAVPNRREP